MADRTEIFVVTIDRYADSLCGENFAYHVHDAVGIIKKHYSGMSGFCRDFEFTEIDDGYRLDYVLYYDWDKEGDRCISYARKMKHINSI